jgi:hypothetical protein
VAVGLGRPDYLVSDSLVVEIKAVREVVPVHQAQVMSYLRSFGMELGLLMNFREVRLRDGIRRVIWSGGQEKTRNMNEPHEASNGLVVPSRDSAIPFEVMKEDLDSVS